MTSDEGNDLEWTGERYVPQIRGTIALEHLHRYAFASEYAKGRVVLDIASGEGYGSKMLSRTAEHVYGVDVDVKAVQHAMAKYPAENLEFKLGSCSRIPLPDASVDVIVSFETIEHIADHDRMMLEVKRVLRPAGVLLISSPDKHVYSELPAYKNQFHLKELYREEFQTLLEQNFKHVTILGQKVFYGSALIGLSGQESVSKTYQFTPLPDKIESEAGLSNPLYLVGICSDVLLKKVEATLCEQDIRQSELVIHQNNRITLLESSLQVAEVRILEQEAQVSAKSSVSQNHAWGSVIQGMTLKGLSKVRNIATELIERCQGNAKASDSVLNEEKANPWCRSLPRDPEIIFQKDVVSTVKERVEYELLSHTDYSKKLTTELKREIASLKSSLSWEVTAPLRHLDNKYPHILQGLRKYLLAARIILTHRTSGVFEPEWYLLNNPDVKAAGMNPWIHFSIYGIGEGRLPRSDFDPLEYLKKTPGVVLSGLNPVHHWMVYGWRMGKKAAVYNIKTAMYNNTLNKSFKAQLKNLDNEKKTLLLVTHEASRTGAPIIAFDLLMGFKKTHNVIVCSLKGGVLERAFRKHASIFIENISNEKAEENLKLYISSLGRDFKPAFSIVNTIESTRLIDTLWKLDIPVIHLIHEFASTTHQQHRFANSALVSSEMVFPAEIVRQDVLRMFDYMKDRSMAVHSQGICASAKRALTDEMRISENHGSSGCFPDDLSKEAMVVLGCGTCCFRKGVDLFIACARQVTNQRPGLLVKFIWVGGNFNPESDFGYSCYIAEQIKQSSLEGVVLMIDEVEDMKAFYERADVFFMSSRADPMPLVAQDALDYGVPVVCFEGAGGIPEVLMENNISSFGVVPYLDVNTAAQRIYMMLDDPELRKNIGLAGRAIIKQKFVQSNYVEALQEIAKKSETRNIIEIRDREIIRQSGLFDINFSYPALTHDMEQALRSYTAAWRTGLGQKKPMKGFHPGIYAEFSEVKGRDPFADYIENGQPAGLWNSELIELKRTQTKSFPTIRAALHIHLFYPEMAQDIINRLKVNAMRPDLYISLSADSDIESLKKRFREVSGDQIIIKRFPNKGRDLGPFLTGFAEELQSYDVVGHIHTKKSPHVKERDMIKSWVELLMENVLGGSYAMMDLTLEAFAREANLGIVFPDDPNVIGWTKNTNEAELLLKRMKLECIMPQRFFNFPIGSMFWIRPSAIKPLFDLRLNWSDYPDEPVGIDGTILHAIERLIPLISSEMSYKTAITSISGITR